MAAACALLMVGGCGVKREPPPPLPDVKPPQTDFSELPGADLPERERQMLELMQRLAERGDSEAQYLLGLTYYHGKGVPADRETGRRWIERAAGQGHDRARETLARLADNHSEGPQPPPPDPVPAARPVPATPPGPVRTPKATVGRPSQPGGRSWLQQQPRANWTIQILGVRNPLGGAGFQRTRRLEGPTAEVVYDRDGSPWHVLVYGSFATSGAAFRALAALPAEIRTSGPWVRTFGEIQDAVAGPAPGPTPD